MTKYIHNNDDTKVLSESQYNALNDPDKEYDYGVLVTGPVTDALTAKNQHTGKIENLASRGAVDNNGQVEPCIHSRRRSLPSGAKQKPEMTHTMGDYLLPAFKEFQGLQLMNANFWEWVEEEIRRDAEGSAKRWNPALYKATEPKYHQHLIRWFTAGVKYINEQQTRERYKITYKSGLLMRLLRSSDTDVQALDKKEVVDQFTKKGNPAGALIWVLGSGTFFSHMAKVGRFHHSSFFQGGEVTAAGEWDVEKGKLVWISGQSGHYRPDFDFLEDALKALPADVISTGNTKVRLFDASKAVDMPVQEFQSKLKQKQLGSLKPFRT